MKNTFNETYKKIILECNEKGLISESWLGDKLRGAKNFLRKVNHFGSAKESEKIHDEFKERFATLMKGIGFNPGAKDKTCFSGEAEDGRSIGFKVMKNSDGQTKLILYNTEAGCEKGSRKKLQSKEISPSAGDDTFRKVMNELLEKEGIPVLSFKDKKDQEKEAEDQKNTAHETKVNDEEE